MSLSQAHLVRIDRLLDKAHPELAKALRPGASDTAIARVRKAVRVELPRSFTALYKWHDGSEIEEFLPEWGWLPISRVLSEYAALKKVHREHAEHYDPQWIPIMSNFGGDHLCLDMRGSFHGAPGQLIGVSHEGAARVEFASIEKLVETVERAAKKKALVWDDDDDEGEERYDRVYRQVNVGYPHKGNPKLEALKQKIADAEANPKRVLQLIARALKLDPTDQTLFAKKYNACVELERYDEALEALEIELRSRPSPSRLSVRRLELLLELGRFSDVVASAAALLRAQTKRKSNDFGAGDLADAYSALSKAYIALGDRAKALEAARKAVSVYEGPEKTAAELWRACADLERNEKKRNAALVKTRTIYDRWIQLNQVTANDADAWYNLACVCALLHDSENALSKLERAIELDPDFKTMAVADIDFVTLKASAAFRALTGNETRAPARRGRPRAST